MSEGHDIGGQADRNAAGFGRDRPPEDRVRETRVRGGTGEQESLADLISGLLQDLQDLVRGEIRLARTELREDAMQAGRGVALIAAGALVGLTGFIFLMLGLTYLLDKEMPLWLAAAIVGAVLAAIALACLALGRNRLKESNFRPEQTIETLKEDQEWANRQMRSVRK
jgi:uncharacterized membrane protein YqjE